MTLYLVYKTWVDLDHVLAIEDTVSHDSGTVIGRCTLAFRDKPLCVELSDTIWVPWDMPREKRIKQTPIREAQAIWDAFIAAWSATHQMTEPTLTLTDRPVLGLGCVRQSGKDTLARLLRELDKRFVAFSFASALKHDLSPFLQQNYGVDIWTCPIEDKEWVRPLLIAHGMCQRARDPDYWVKRTMTDIERNIEALCPTEEMTPGGAVIRARVPIIPVITDCRFVNEVTLMRERFPGFRFVNVSRRGAPPPTEEETRHRAAVSAMADLQFEWGNDTSEEQVARACELRDWLLS